MAFLEKRGGLVPVYVFLFLVSSCDFRAQNPSICRNSGDLCPSTQGMREVRMFCLLISRAAKRGCFKRGGFPIWTCPSFFVLFCPFGTFPGIFPICPGTLRGFSRLVLFLFLGLLSAPTRNSPESVRDTIWTFPEKSGKHPGLETPGFSFSQ